MFTGIIQAMGSIDAIVSENDVSRYSITTPEQFLTNTVIGDSIAVQGVCLTVVDIQNNTFVADVSNETLQCTTLGAKKATSQVNLEAALTLSARLGGHLVSGHVDGVGEVTTTEHDGDSIRISIHAPSELARYIARKGSVCIDGVSLTVNAVKGEEFSVNIIPHTLQNTTLSECAAGSKVNLEVDLLARYLERLQTCTS